MPREKPREVTKLEPSMKFRPGSSSRRTRGGLKGKARLRQDVDRDLMDRQCLGKEAYPSEQAAQAARAFFHAETIGRDKLRHVDAYDCPFCPSWHLGTRG